MSLKTVRSFIGSMVNPLAALISEKIAGHFGKKESRLRHVAIQSLAFILLLIPIMLVVLMMVGTAIFSFQMLRAGF